MANISIAEIENLSKNTELDQTNIAVASKIASVGSNIVFRLVGARIDLSKVKASEDDDEYTVDLVKSPTLIIDLLTSEKDDAGREIVEATSVSVKLFSGTDYALQNVVNTVGVSGDLRAKIKKAFGSEKNEIFQEYLSRVIDEAVVEEVDDDGNPTGEMSDEADDKEILRIVEELYEDLLDEFNKVCNGTRYIQADVVESKPFVGADGKSHTSLRLANQRVVLDKIGEEDEE